MLLTLIKQAQRKVSNQSASKCYQNTSVFPGISSDIALLTDGIILDINRARQTCDERNAFYLQRCDECTCLMPERLDQTKLWST